MIVAVHLYDNFSGAPAVLRQTIEATLKAGRNVKLYVGSGSEGFLAQCEVPTQQYWYRRSRWRLLTFISYVYSQIDLLIRLLCDRSIEKDATIFINTLIPFGAGLYGWATGRKVIYHVHEISISPKYLRKFLVMIASRSSFLNIYVSKAHASLMPITGVPSKVIYNSLDEEFVAKAKRSGYVHRRTGAFNVLMIASLRPYKGIEEFYQLVQDVGPDEGVEFDLILSETDGDIERYFNGRLFPSNLRVHSSIQDPSGFLSRADLLLNLSRVDQWVETFGLTILEAMYFGIPVIVPPVGGPAEIIVNGEQGFLIDSRDRVMLAERVLNLANDRVTCTLLSESARIRAEKFSPEKFSKQITQVV